MMVRLIDSLFVTKAPVSCLFQFHDGAIDRLKWSTSAKAVWWFQFHDGAIDRQQHVNYAVTEPSFNSMMVRLIVCTRALAVAIKCGFNSMMVRLIVETN